ncbi:peptide ligase PGM1-related protein [Aetokthonos hydrillicola Thurmond2011]|jgi:hypothetical protein|uniref:Peptide ligase PGM1-related protein n=1 Tax=Aetokthonos hydrillicola Thurmond2011 TaxID=2712845 RepID=A0AAP5I5Q9_9CYAN|nr:peptide ligase PGM1-related protein [Aetokthonos hydrillicola]MBW4584685.1 hypothetical protein [Aetokthonos hydrillicola CCALA 1050]MDR9895229.1 peptide ligase PGM1-related protein [Aetokthonos hydrillicola Thurmond2011]
MNLVTENKDITSAIVTKIVLYSINYSEGFLREMPFATYFVERSLCHLEILRDQSKRLILITPQLVDPYILHYHFREVYQMNDEQECSARKRLVLLSPKLKSSESLIDLVLEDAEILKYLEKEKKQVDYIEIINFSPCEKVELLGQKLGCTVQEYPNLLSRHWGSKLGGKDIFLKCDVPTPRGTSNILKNLGELKNVVLQLANANPPVRYVMVKLNEGGWSAGLGNVVIDCEKLIHTNELSESIYSILQSWKDFEGEIFKGGAMAEEYVPGATCSPSVQGYIDNDGQVKLLSSHEQILEQGKYLGCIFPAQPKYLTKIYAATEKIGRSLSASGVRGTFGIDFLGFENGEVLAVEVNVRKLGTSHVLSYVEAIIGNKVDPDGLLRDKNGSPIHYVQSRLYEPALLTYLNPQTAVETLKKKNLLYEHTKQTGAVLHTLGALEACGFVEITTIEHSREKAFERNKDAQKVLLDKALEIRSSI